MSDQRNTVNDARFSLIVRGDNLSFNEIENGLGVKATRLIHKGEELNRLPKIIAEEDEWMLTVPLTAHQGFDPKLNSLLAMLVEKAQLLEGLKQKYKVMLRLFVQSDEAQMAYKLMPETLAKIVATGLPLDVSSVSWGEIKL